jgi:predicted membrane-bound spermidine synthase
VLVLTVFCILVPLWASRGRDLRGAGPLLIFFICIGLGFMLVETSQMQRLIIALGHPTYALSVVLFALLLSSGLGSYLTADVPAERLAAIGGRRLLILVGILILFGAITPFVVRASAAASNPARIAAAVALLFPAGLVMGMAFPLGMKLAARRAAVLTPWLWGLNGAASVLASVLSVCIALTWSISAAFWAGCLAYAIAFVAFRRAAAAVY